MTTHVDSLASTYSDVGSIPTRSTNIRTVLKQTLVSHSICKGFVFYKTKLNQILSNCRLPIGLPFNRIGLGNLNVVKAFAVLGMHIPQRCYKALELFCLSMSLKWCINGLIRLSIECSESLCQTCCPNIMLHYFFLFFNPKN